MEFNEPFFSGGLYCLNFINTFDHRHTPPQYDFLPDREALLEWGRVAGTAPKRRRAAEPSAGQSMARVRTVRGLIFRVLAPFAHSGTPSRADLSAFNELLRETNREVELVSDGGRYRLACSSDNPTDRILCEAVRSAADLLLSDRQDRIRECSECGWLFFDSTRNGSRRWCMMSICGNRAKARRHYERVRRAKQLRKGKGRPTRAMAGSH
jgi:predicted RNA-binding Zn ribbon-like protein